MFSSTPIIGPVIRDLWHFTKQETAFQLQTQRTGQPPGQHTGQRPGQRIRTGLYTRLPTHRPKLHFTPVTDIIKQVSSFSCPVVVHASILRMQSYGIELLRMIYNQHEQRHFVSSLISKTVVHGNEVDHRQSKLPFRVVDVTLWT